MAIGAGIWGPNPQSNVQIEPVSVSDRFQALAEGRVDVLFGATTVTMSRNLHEVSPANI